MSTTHSYKVPAFHFRVYFSGLEFSTEQDRNFESVTGIQGSVVYDTSLHTDDKNTIAFQPAVFKRAVAAPGESPLRQWALACLKRKSPPFLPEIKIEVLNNEHIPVLVILLKEVYLKNWGLGELHAQNSNLLIEEISFSYRALDIL